jgi:hypothetical protein
MLSVLLCLVTVKAILFLPWGVHFSNLGSSPYISEIYESRAHKRAQKEKEGQPLQPTTAGPASVV